MTVQRHSSFGTLPLSLVDRLGIWLSRRAILRHLTRRHPYRVLELGCGYAACNLFAIEDVADKLVAVDVNLSTAVKSHPKFVAIESRIEETLPQLATEQFDVILLISVLEHLRHPEEVLQACKNMLGSGGVLLVNVPTWLGKLFLEFSAFRLRLSPKQEMDDHKMYYDKRDLWPLLVKVGFLPSAITMYYHKLGLNLFAVAKQETI